MDRKTFIQFLIISALVFGVWYLFVWLFLPKQAPAQGPVEGGLPAEMQPHAGVTEEAPAPAIAAAPEKQIDVLRGLPLGNEVIHSTWTNVGAALEKMQLKGYKVPYFTHEGGEKAPVLTLLQEFSDDSLSDLIESVTLVGPPGAGGEAAQETVLRVDTAIYEVKEQTENRIVFETLLGGVLNVRKTVTIEPGAHHFNVELAFVNATDKDLGFSYRLRGAAGIEAETPSARDMGTVVGIAKGSGYKVIYTGASRLTEGPNTNESTGILWAGTANQYFVAVTQPQRSDWIKSVESVDIGHLRARRLWKSEVTPEEKKRRQELARRNSSTVILSTQLSLPAGQSIQHSYRFIGAPKLDRVLAPYGNGMTDVLQFGMFSSVSRVMLALLKFFYFFIPNYGVAILLLTLVVKVVLHPLTVKGQMSAYRSQLLQPKIAELRKKYADDKQKMAQEQMMLFRTYGVHPMSGCLPLLFQFPIFLALYRTLSNAVELRHAGFIPGWITDLSAPDTIYHYPLPLSIPLLSSLTNNNINILPVLMVITSVVSQSLAPQPADPQAQQQQKIMKWMWVFMALMFYNLASGLLLYWTFSGAIGILEQWMIRKRSAGMELTPVSEAGPKTQGAKKGGVQGRRRGFFERLMHAAEEQQKKSQQLRKTKNNKRR